MLLEGIAPCIHELHVNSSTPYPLYPVKVCDAPNPTRPAPLPKPRKERPSQMSIEGEADGEVSEEGSG